VLAADVWDAVAGLFAARSPVQRGQ